MQVRIFSLLLVLSIAAPVNGAEAARTLLVYGDSLSAAYGMEEEQGWVALLERRINDGKRPYRVINGSVSGETSTSGLARLPAMLAAYRPELVILELGGNDGLRGLPLELLKANLKKMIALIRDADAEILLAGIQIPPNYGPRYTQPFYALFREIAAEESLPLVPFLLEGIPQQAELMQADGIHPVAEAQPVILENVWPYLEPLLK